jgi:hypothetical protein
MPNLATYRVTGPVREARAEWHMGTIFGKKTGNEKLDAIFVCIAA